MCLCSLLVNYLKSYLSCIHYKITLIPENSKIFNIYYPKRQICPDIPTLSIAVWFQRHQVYDWRYVPVKA